MTRAHLLVLEDGRPVRVLSLDELPLTIGSGEDCGLRLEGDGVPPLHGEIERSERGNLRYLILGEDRMVRLKPDTSIEVGPYRLALVELPEAQGSDLLTPLLDLVPALWEAREEELPVRPLLRVLRTVFRARWGAVVRDGKVLHHEGERPPGAGKSVSRTVLERLRTEEAPVLQVEVGADPELSEAASIPPEVRAVIAGELRHEDVVEGVVYLENPVGGKQFTPEEARLLRRLAAFAGEVLARARTARELDRRVALLERERRRLRRLAREAWSPGELVGSSEAVEALRNQIEQTAATDVTVLIEGESGTGKELVARAVHASGRRAEEPFVAVNCAAVPVELLESELFGHVKGAFTGASRDRAGRFELAHGGTLFLDELAELPLEAQAKLLRVLEERRIQPVGADAPVPVDIRLVAATGVDLEEAVEAGRFREDLFYRVAVFRIRTPPLRERPGDVAALAEHFTATFARTHGRPARGLTERALEILQAHPWPGNVRELRNRIEAAVVRADGARLRPADLGLVPGERGPELDVPEPMDLAEARMRFEKAFLTRALREHRGDMKAVKKVLGISQTTLYERCKELGLRPKDFRG